jgi:superfamily II helicase
MKRRGPWTVRTSDNSLFFKLEEFSLSKAMLFGVKAASMSSERTCVCVYCVMNAMSRMVSMKVSAKSIRKGVEELLDRRRDVGK